MTIEELRASGGIIFESIAGSRAYGLATESSDTDIRGVFVLPQETLYGLYYIEQVNDERNNVVFYEIRKVVELLLRNNPTMLELLAMPQDCIVYKHPAFDILTPSMFLSKLCKESFAGYAHSQIKKAKGLNKKILNPVARERKSVLDFCYVQYKQGTQQLGVWLTERGFKQEHCGLVRLAHFRDCYALYYDEKANYAGIMRSEEDSNDVCLSSVPKEAEAIGIVSFNKDGYSRYCKDYREYWDWVEQRNEERYQNTLEHGKNYDAKNMVHVFRLLDMAEEIAAGELYVRRPNREQLLSIKRGEANYEELLIRADEQLHRIEESYLHSSLPDAPDTAKVDAALVEIRRLVYMKA